MRTNAHRDIFQARIARVYFWSALISSLLQFVPLAIVLTLTIKEPCDGMPRVFLVFYTLNLVTNVVQLIYHHHHPLDLDAHSIPICPRRGTPRLMFRWKEYSDIFFVLSMVLGVLGLFSVTCAASSPILYWTTIAVLSYNCLLVIAPLILITILFCCLPCAIFLLRYLYPEPNRGAPETVISALPKYKYSTSADDRAYGDAAIQPEDAVCPICLQEYLDQVQIRVLPCRHHFHLQCADEWFRLQATCPLCVRPIAEEPPRQPTPGQVV